jgi:hypothetical protein
MTSEVVSKQAVGITCRCGSCATELAGHETEANLARRGFLRSAVTGSVVGVLAAATITRPRPASTLE